MVDYQKDFTELCALLNANAVDYVIVGGYALAFHGAPRYTNDLDLLVGPTDENVSKLLTSLVAFGLGDAGAMSGDLLSRQKILQLGRPPVQVHIMTAITGVSWETAWTSKEPGEYGGCPVWYLGRHAFLANKRAAGRAKDLADLHALRTPKPR